MKNQNSTPANFNPAGNVDGKIANVSVAKRLIEAKLDAGKSPKPVKKSKSSLPVNPFKGMDAKETVVKDPVLPEAPVTEGSEVTVAAPRVKKAKKEAAPKAPKVPKAPKEKKEKVNHALTLNFTPGMSYDEFDKANKGVWNGVRVTTFFKVQVWNTFNAFNPKA